MPRRTKQAHPLQGNDGGRDFFEPLQVGPRFFPGPESGVLLAKSGTSFRSPVAWIVQFPSRASHRRHCRRLNVERLHLFEMIQVFKKELRLMRKLAKRERTTIHERLDDTREKTSHQSRPIVRNQALTAAGSRLARNSVRRFFCSWCKGRSGKRGIPPRYPRWSMACFTPAMLSSETIIFEARPRTNCSSRAFSCWPCPNNSNTATHFSATPHPTPTIAPPPPPP